MVINLLPEPKEPPEKIKELTPEDLLTVISRLYLDWASTEGQKFKIKGWTTVEAFARFTGVCVRINALPGKEEVVLVGAMQAIKAEFDKTHLTLLMAGRSSNGNS